MPGRIYDATYGRLFAAAYNLFLGAAERTDLRQHRQALLASASGATVEIGAGTGANLGFYPTSVTELVLTEPDEHMVKHLRKTLEKSTHSAEVVISPGERLPFDDNRFDTAVATLVLCTAPDPEAVLREIDRVLKPGGQMIFLEHVRATSPALARWQDRMHGAWFYAFAGCHCNRDTMATINRSPLGVERFEELNVPWMLLGRPVVAGVARR